MYHGSIVERCAAGCRVLKSSEELSSGLQSTEEVSRGCKRCEELCRGFQRYQETSRALQRSQEVARDLKRSQEVWRGVKRSQEVSRRLQMRQEASRGVQRSPEGVRGPQRASEGLRGLQRASEGFRGLQRASETNAPPCRSRIFVAREDGCARSSRLPDYWSVGPSWILRIVTICVHSEKLDRYRRISWNNSLPRPSGSVEGLPPACGTSSIYLSTLLSSIHFSAVQFFA